MSHYRIRPKGEFIQEASWNKLYFLTKSWKGDLECYKIDIKALIYLLDSYFSKLFVHENLDELQEIQIDFLNLYNECEGMFKDTFALAKAVLKNKNPKIFWKYN